MHKIRNNGINIRDLGITSTYIDEYFWFDGKS
jgi:hypothetical protein